MKCQIPQISWHNRDPVLSLDFQVVKNGIRRIATSSTDTHVLIWHLTLSSGSNNVSLECVADLSRHSKTVNVVRFSPNGEILASADDEAAIILWKQQTRIEGDIFADDDGDVNKENWTPLRILRGHIDDICDLSWSADNLFLVTGSVDNTAIMWDVTKGKNLGLLSDHKGFVQGVSWDPLGQFIATLCSDRVLRIYNITTKKVLHRVQKMVHPNNSPKEGQEQIPPKPTRIFYDDTLKSFCRRLSFSPDGTLLIVPSGIIEENEGKINNATYVFTRNSLNKPVLYLPTGDKFTLAVRCCPVLFELRNVPQKKNSTGSPSKDKSSENVSLFCLPYRVLFAVATQDSILFYDSQQTMPFAKVNNIHYTRLSDLAWSSDGKVLIASSTDGYCSFVVFSEGELGTPYIPKDNEENKQTENVVTPTDEGQGMDWTLVLEPSTDLPPEVPSQKDVTSKIQLQPMEDISKLTDCLNSTSIEKSDKITVATTEAGQTSKLGIVLKNKETTSTVEPKVTLEPSNVDVKPNSSKKAKAPRRIQLITLSSSVNK